MGLQPYQPSRCAMNILVLQIILRPDQDLISYLDPRPTIHLFLIALFGFLRPPIYSWF